MKIKKQARNAEAWPSVVERNNKNINKALFQDNLTFKVKL